MSSKTRSEDKSAHPFVRDLEPFFYGRPITYVDVGAYHGSVLLELLRSSIRVREAHLVEPNPESFRTLQQAVAEIDKVNQVACHNVAVSSSPGMLTMRAEGTMTHVSDAPEAGSQPSAKDLYFEVAGITLDELARDAQIDRIDLLKIDVEGHELAVLAGAKELLASERIDVVYLEAGMNPDATQHVYYRDVEDALRAHGYRLFRIYEQRHEWPEDSPALRRANLAFISATFAASHPYNLSRELVKLRKRQEELTSRAVALEEQVRDLENQSATLRDERDNALQQAEAATDQRDLRDRELTAARAERDALAAYADDLEAKINQVLKSSSWRLTRPVRLGARTVRRVLGRPAAGPTRLPTRPSRKDLAAGGRRAVSGTAGRAEQIIALLRKTDFAATYQLLRKFQEQWATEDGFLSYSFAMVALARKSSTFAFGAQGADAVLDRYRDRRADLVKAYGQAGYRRFVSDAAANYTRIGRYSDARALLDAEITHGDTSLLPVRAEISWIHDPAQALRDLATSLQGGGQDTGRRANALLREHLALNVLGEPSAADAGDEDGEFRLVRAIRALSEERTRDYRDLVNGFFADQGLAHPFGTADGPFSFDELSPHTSERRTGGPLVSVIMTTYNSEGTIHYAVRSILDQTHQNLELLIIDDGSSDSTAEKLSELAASDERITLIENGENVGTYAARNKAMAQARGEYITFHDSDDWAHPQRLAVHIDAMADDPGLLATRSMWLRVEPTGEIDFRRWHKRLAHPNPASIFIRRDLIERIGYFDTVRFGADSEYWYRARRICGRSAVSSLDACLGLGLHHPASLTRSGVGGRSEEDYAPIRAAYQYSWLEWQSTRPAEQLRLPAGAEGRVFWAPDEMLARPVSGNAQPGSLARSYPDQLDEHTVPTFLFGISLASKKASADWRATQRLLGRTLRSVLNQTDGRWRVVVCGHDRPDVPELDDPRVAFMVADIAPPADAKNFRKDKMWKRRLIGSFLRDLGGGYFCPLDADDLVHKDLVKHVLSDDNRRGYNISTGYVQDFATGRLGPVPGVWSAPFDRVCGTSAVLYFTADELPRDGRMDPALYFNLFQSHAYWPVVAEECGRPLDSVPFPGAVYVVNHSQNLSFGLQRAGERTLNIISSIRQHAIDDGESVLARDFGQL